MEIKKKVTVDGYKNGIDMLADSIATSIKKTYGCKEVTDQMPLGYSITYMITKNKVGFEVKQGQSIEPMAYDKDS